MDSADRHFRTSSTNSTTSTATASSELFICFTSRSSSMKISSKSILSPGRARDSSQISLSTSLSRRLKSSGSLKGGQASPMFPTGGKKRGCAFDNPEPSSPKVTCIGQVRVKTKKQGKKMRARSQKRRTSSEASFRKSENAQAQASSNDQQFLVRQSSNPHHLLRQNSSSNTNSNGGNGFQQECLSHRNQRWVHLPFTICEALRAFGAELNCFLPCHSSCSSGRENSKESKPAASERSCGTVFARWLVAVQDGEGKGREIELVVGDEETRTEMENRSQRRHVFEGLDFKEEEEEEKKEVMEEEQSRISICIPPKNALLLMRCRSDPVKMAELAKRFCESPAPKVEEEEVEESRQNEAKRDAAVPLTSTLTTTVSKKEEEEERKMELRTEEETSKESVSDGEEETNLFSQEEEEEEEATNLFLQEEETLVIMATENEIDVQKLDITVVNHQCQEEEEEDEDIIIQDNQQEKLSEETMVIPIPTHFEPEMAQDAAEKVESAESESKLLHGNEQDHETEENEEQRIEPEEENLTSPSISVETEQISEETVTETEEEEEENRGESTEEVKETTTTTTTPMMITHWDDEEKATDEGIGMGPEEEEEEEERETEASVLPDCLLLMMYEPKLSMEVSKETWVCSTDFIRCVPTREKKAVGRDPPPPPPPKKRETKKPPENNTQPAPLQPARWSCSFPAAAAAAAMIEQKLVRAKGGGYEPFVLTRCKSEPVRSSAKLAPDPGCWKDRQLEPHRPATFGVGAAEVGF